MVLANKPLTGGRGLLKRARTVSDGFKWLPPWTSYPLHPRWAELIAVLPLTMVQVALRCGAECMIRHTGSLALLPPTDRHARLGCYASPRLINVRAMAFSSTQSFSVTLSANIGSCRASESPHQTAFVSANREQYSRCQYARAHLQNQLVVAGPRLIVPPRAHIETRTFFVIVTLLVKRLISVLCRYHIAPARHHRWVRRGHSAGSPSPTMGISPRQGRYPPMTRCCTSMPEGWTRKKRMPMVRHAR